MKLEKPKINSTVQIIIKNPKRPYIKGTLKSITVYDTTIKELYNLIIKSINDLNDGTTNN